MVRIWVYGNPHIFVFSTHLAAQFSAGAAFPVAPGADRRAQLGARQGWEARGEVHRVSFGGEASGQAVELLNLGYTRFVIFGRC